MDGQRPTLAQIRRWPASVNVEDAAQGARHQPGVPLHRHRRGPEPGRGDHRGPQEEGPDALAGQRAHRHRAARGVRLEHSKPGATARPARRQPNTDPPAGGSRVITTVQAAGSYASRGGGPGCSSASPTPTASPTTTWSARSSPSSRKTAAVPGSRLRRPRRPRPVVRRAGGDRAGRNHAGSPLAAGRRWRA